MDKYIGFDIAYKKTVTCVAQKGTPDKYDTLPTEVNVMRLWNVAYRIASTVFSLVQGAAYLTFFSANCFSRVSSRASMSISTGGPNKRLSSSRTAGILPSLACLSNARTTAPPHGSIVVHLRGRLSVTTAVEPGGRPQDDAACELTSATVHAGGTVIELDWSRSDRIRDELLWWRLPRHGDLRQVQAEVTGRMVFMPSRDLGGDRTVPAGVSGGTSVPVVIVESLEVQLVGLDGKRRGPQHDRERAIAD